ISRPQHNFMIIVNLSYSIHANILLPQHISPTLFFHNPFPTILFPQHIPPPSFLHNTLHHHYSPQHIPPTKLPPKNIPQNHSL
ncbi:hypothetical protein BC829DRAFT_391902, partial [Chytridium lagenaria]